MAKKFHRYMVVPHNGSPTYFRFRWLARFVAWWTGWKFQDSNEQVTL